MRSKKELQAEPRPSLSPPKCRCVAEGQGNSSELCPYKIHPSASPLICKRAAGCIPQTGQALEVVPHAPDLPKLLAEAEIKLSVDTPMLPGRSVFMLLICHRITVYSKTETLTGPCTPRLHLPPAAPCTRAPAIPRRRHTSSAAASPTPRLRWQDGSSAPSRNKAERWLLPQMALAVAQTPGVLTGHLPRAAPPVEGINHAHAFAASLSCSEISC